MVASERMKRAETEEELQQAKKEHEALKSALKLVEGEYANLRVKVATRPKQEEIVLAKGRVYVGEEEEGTDDNDSDNDNGDKHIPAQTRSRSSSAMAIKSTPTSPSPSHDDLDDYASFTIVLPSSPAAKIDFNDGNTPLASSFATPVVPIIDPTTPVGDLPEL